LAPNETRFTTESTRRRYLRTVLGVNVRPRRYTEEKLAAANTKLELAESAAAAAEAKSSAVASTQAAVEDATSDAERSTLVAEARVASSPTQVL